MVTALHVHSYQISEEVDQDDRENDYAKQNCPGILVQIYYALQSTRSLSDYQCLQKQYISCMFFRIVACMLIEGCQRRPD